jgi:hypothetical protein
MRRAAPFLAWAALLAVTATGLLLWSDDTVAVILLPAAVLVALVVAAAALRAREPVTLAVADASISGPLLALGLAGVALGAAVGWWASLMGAGTLVLAAIAAVRERRG